MKEKSSVQKKSKVLRVIIQLLIGGSIGLFGGIFAVDNLSTDNWTITTLILSVLFFFIAIFVHINIHEFGHFIFGKIFGYKLISYRVSIFTWNNENGKMKFSIIKNKGYGGLCAMIPPDQTLPAYKEVLFYFGGILLNIISGLVFISLPFLFRGFEEPIKLFFAALGWIGLVLGTINFIPFISQNNATDGKLIWSLVLKDPFAKKMMQINKMSSQFSAGVRPRDMQISSLIDIDNPQVFDMMTMLFSYFKALDNSNFEDMLHYVNLLENNIETFPHYSLPSLYYELCYMACISGDENKAKVYYEKGGKILQKDKDVNGLRVKAYYEYHVNKNIKSAIVFCENALAVVDKFPIKGLALMEMDLIKHLKEVLSNEERY